MLAPNRPERRHQGRLRQASKAPVVVVAGAGISTSWAVSLGMAAGEAIVRGLELAVGKENRPSSCSRPPAAAGCRKAFCPLMQMPRTHRRRADAAEAKQPYIVVLTNPTNRRRHASYAMLGDVQIAEPGALIGFAGAA